MREMGCEAEALRSFREGQIDSDVAPNMGQEREEAEVIHLLFAPVIVAVILFSIVVRLITAPFRMGRWHRRYYGYDPYYNPYRYGCRRHHGLLGGVLPILALVALDRIFNRRFW